MPLSPGLVNWFCYWFSALWFRLSIRPRPARLSTQSSALGCLDVDRRPGSGRRRRGDGVSGRGQVQEGADGAGHLGEPSLLQDV